MRVSLMDTSEYAEINNLQEVKSPILIDRNAGPHPDGLISNEIFGYNSKSRKTTYAYIDLKKHFIHPQVYKSIKRFFRAIDELVAGRRSYIITKDGQLKEDPSGETGIDWLYNNWNKIKWKTEGETLARAERTSVLVNYKRDEIWMTKFIVIPAFYRDILDTSKGAETGDLNGLYIKLIRQTSMLNDSAMFDFAFYNVEYQIQNTMVEIYDYFKGKLEKKNGLIRKALMSKTIDYGSRTIITAPMYYADRCEDMPVDADHMAVPLPQVCATMYPQMVRELKNWFDRNLFSTQYLGSSKSDKTYKLYKPEEKYNDEFITKMLNNYINNPGSRFDMLTANYIDENKNIMELPLKLSGEVIEKSTSHPFNRSMCVTDLLYIVGCEAVRDKIVMFTRYPELGTFFNKINIVSTNQYQQVKIGERLYKWYPIVDYSLTHEQLTSYFKDSISFDNCYCAAASADYDGDQVTIKILWSEEANREAEKFIYSKQNILNANGMSNRRTIESEAVQTMYVLTKDPPDNQKAVSDIDVDKILTTPISEMTYEWFVNFLGDRYIDNKIVPAKYRGSDKIKLTKAKYKYLKQDIETTLGRLLFNRYLLESNDLYKAVDFVNEPVTAKRLGKLESELSEALLNDVITGEQFIHYISRRDYFGLKLNAMITTSYSQIMMVTPKKVQKLKKKLVAENRAELDAGNVGVADTIEKTLLSEAKAEIQDDPAWDLFASGARGSFNNNYKTTNIMRGAVYNTVKGKYDIITSSLNDGISIKDAAPFGNLIVEGQYPKSVGTQDTGYLQKELIQLAQGEMVDKKGTDCHTKRLIDMTFNESNISGFLFRYILDNGKLVMITKENMSKYVGKTVKMRTPLTCINKYGICNICVGELPYKMGIKNVGLQASQIGTRLTSLNMKGFHDATLKFGELDLDSELK